MLGITLGYLYATVSPHTLFVVGCLCFEMSLTRQRGAMLGRWTQPLQASPMQMMRAGLNAANQLSRLRRQFKNDKSRASRGTAVSQSGSAPLTGQFDYKTDYRRRRLTRRQRFRQRKRRRRNARMVRTVREATIGSSHIVRRHIAPALTSASAASGIAVAGIYGLNGTATDSNNTNDVGSIFADMDMGGWNGANNPLVVSPAHKLRYMHATMEVTISNTGTNDVILEAYYIRGRRPVASEWQNPGVLYVDSFNKQGRANDPDNPTAVLGTSELSATQIGVTPFQSYMFSRSYNIYKRQKFRIPPGNEINLIIHDRRSHLFTMPPTRNNATDSRYHGILFQWQGPAGLVSGGDPPVYTTALPTEITMLVVKRFRLKMVRDDEPKDALDL